MVKNLPAVQEILVRFLGWDDPWRREWLPPPVFLPRQFYGQRSLEGYSSWCRKESDTIEQLTLSSRIWCLMSLTSNPEPWSSDILRLFLLAHFLHLIFFPPRGPVGFCLYQLSYQQTKQFGKLPAHAWYCKVLSSIWCVNSPMEVWLEINKA